MGSADAIRHNLVFLPAGTDNVVAYTINNHANGDKAAQIVVVFNANARAVEQKVDEGTYTVVCRDGVVNAAGLGTSEGGMVMVPPRSALIMYK
jgi:pullulanase